MHRDTCTCAQFYKSNHYRLDRQEIGCSLAHSADSSVHKLPLSDRRISRCSKLPTLWSVWSVHFGAICLRLPLHNQLSFVEVDFSLFVLELLLRNEKRKLSSTFHFNSQIVKQKLEFTIHLELLLPIQKAELFFLYLFWNFRSQNERRNCWGWTFVLEHELKSQVNF